MALRVTRRLAAAAEAGVPGVDQRLQQAEGEHGHGHAEDRQRRAQPVPKRIPEEELPDHR